jgi:hypothetical protein
MQKLSRNELLEIWRVRNSAAPYFPQADLNEAARAADAFACIDTSVRNYPLEEPMTPEVR